MIKMKTAMKRMKNLLVAFVYPALHMMFIAMMMVMLVMKRQVVLMKRVKNLLGAFVCIPCSA